jgi:lysophospholipase L1-like esterase
VLAVVAALALVGCDATATTDSTVVSRPGGIEIDGSPGELGAEGSVAQNANSIDSVVMIGDSITRGSNDELQERFEQLGFEKVLIEAQNGKRMVVSSGDNPGGASVAEFIAASDAEADHSKEVWIVALGTNDIGQYARPDEIAAAVNEVIDAVPEEAALVWVDTYYRDRSEQADVVNSVVRDRVGRRGNGVIAPWTEFVGNEGVLSFDGVHPTTEGAAVFAFVVTDTVREFLGR